MNTPPPTPSHIIAAALHSLAAKLSKRAVLRDPLEGHGLVAMAMKDIALCVEETAKELDKQSL